MKAPYYHFCYLEMIKPQTLHKVSMIKHLQSFHYFAAYSDGLLIPLIPTLFLHFWLIIPTSFQYLNVFIMLGCIFLASGM